MANHPSQSYHFEYADSPATCQHPTPYPAQDEYSRPAFFSYSPDVVKHRKRTSRAQRKVLEEAFRQNPKPSQYTRKLLIHQTGMDRRSLQVWFQNRRAKEKKVAAKATGGSETQGTATTPQGSDNLSDRKEEQKTSTEHLTDSPPLSSVNEETSAGQTVSPPPSIPSIEGPPEKGDSASPAPSRPPVASSKPSCDSTRPSNLHLPHPHDFTHNVRRGSAPAPLGLPVPPTGLYMADHRRTDGLGFNPAHTASTPSSSGPADDIHPLRRGSLPSCYLPGHANGTPSPHLPPIPSDPSIRRASLEHSRRRLASHPYAWQVASANSVLPMSGPTPLTNQLAGSSNVSNPLLRPSNTSVANGRGVNSGSYLSMLDSLSHNHGLAVPPWNGTERAHMRGHHHIPYPPYATSLSTSEIVPGPLPQPGYSFGTAAAPILEDEPNLVPGDEREERNVRRGNTQYPPLRFGSFASTDSSISSASAIYSEGRSSDILGDDEYQAPGMWQPDMRRASCPAPFMSAFAGLAVNNQEDHAAQSNEHLPSLAALTSVESRPQNPGLMSDPGREGYYILSPNSKSFPDTNGYSNMSEYEVPSSYQKSHSPSDDTSQTVATPYRHY